MSAHEEPWQAKAKCGDDPEAMFPDESDQVATAAAKRVCRGCPAVVDCLYWAIDTNQQDGVWGGLAPAELRKMRRSARRRSTAA